MMLALLAALAAPLASPAAACKLSGFLPKGTHYVAVPGRKVECRGADDYALHQKDSQNREADYELTATYDSRAKSVSVYFHPYPSCGQGDGHWRHPEQNDCGAIKPISFTLNEASADCTTRINDWDQEVTELSTTYERFGLPIRFSLVKEGDDFYFTQSTGKSSCLTTPDAFDLPRHY